VLGNLALVDFSILGTSWTLQIEFLAIPFVILAYAAHRRAGAIGIVLTYLAVSLIVSGSVLHQPLLRFARFLPCFAFGMLIPMDFGRRLFNRLPALAAPVAMLAMVSVRSVIGLHWWSATIEELFAAILIGMLYHRRTDHFGGWLEAPLPQYLGRISYSLYLFNVVFLTLAEHWTRDWTSVHRHPLEMGLVLAMPVLASAIVAAHYAEKTLERPSTRFGHEFTVKPSAFA